MNIRACVGEFGSKKWAKVPQDLYMSPGSCCGNWSEIGNSGSEIKDIGSESSGISLVVNTKDW